MFRIPLRPTLLAAALTGSATAAPLSPPAAVRMHTAAQRHAFAAAFLAERTRTTAAPERWTVTTLADAGPGSLREAVEKANARPGIAVVEFDPALEGTLRLGERALYVTDSILIVGNGAERLALDAEGRHGVIATAGYGLDAIDVTILGVTIRGGAADRGAGIAASNTRLLLADSVVEDNDTTNSLVDEQGGGVYLNGGSLTLDRCLVRRNSAGASGGGVTALAAAVSIRDSAFERNLSKRGGGLFVDTPYAVDVRRSVIAFNRAGRRGGGIDLTVTGVPAVLENVTVSGNFVYGEQATDGGGGIALTGPARIALSTIASNLAYTLQRNPDVAAGLQFDSSYGVLFLNGTLLWGNATLDGNLDLGRAGAGGIDSYYNLIGVTTPDAVNGAELGSLFATDPLLGPLADNGGPTQTQAIAADSPARDAAAWIQYYATTDQRGFARRRADDTVMDIGAYEYGADVLLADGFDG
jgi:hypothetical protein